jgi:hypothetical protein
MITIGIDIGLTGALGAVDSRGSCAVRDIPTKPDGTGRRIDGRALLTMLREFVPAGEQAIAVIEDVRPRPQGNGGAFGNTMHSQGSLMGSRRAIEATCDIAGIEVKVVQPKAWYGLLKSEKGASLAKARVLFPDILHELTRVKDHNRAESLLIAHFVNRTMT